MTKAEKAKGHGEAKLHVLDIRDDAWVERERIRLMSRGYSEAEANILIRRHIPMEEI